jgi:hypothetical protein
MQLWISIFGGLLIMMGRPAPIYIFLLPVHSRTFPPKIEQHAPSQQFVPP